MLPDSDTITNDNGGETVLLLEAVGTFTPPPNLEKDDD